MEDGSNLHRELFLASTALVTLLVGKPEGIADLAATHADDLTIRPTHRRDFINANLLIAKVLNRVYECLGVCHKERIATLVRLVKYIITHRVGIVTPANLLQQIQANFSGTQGLRAGESHSQPLVHLTAQLRKKIMYEPFKISRVLPPHELNAGRARKRVLPQPPPVAQRSIAGDHFAAPKLSPNDHVFNHGNDRITDHE
jgi:hypothetical protein